MVFASIMIFPLCYYLTMVIWMPRSLLERGQFLLGLSIFTIGGPFINIGVTIYAVIFMDNFGWGKTRKVVAETGEAEEPDAEDQHQRYVDAVNTNEKIVGSHAIDEESQIANLPAARFRAPFTAEPPQPR